VAETQTNNTSTCAPRARHNDRSRAGRSLTWRLAVAFLSLAALLAPPIASATSSWWNRDWQYRKAITIKLPTMSSAGTPAAVVLPIRLHAGDFSYFQDVQPSGADLRFVADDGTPLKYQLELLDPAAGLLVAWIEVPVKADVTQQPVWMYYGNPRATRPDDTALYDADQVLVLHFAESQGLPRDATANRYDPAISSAQLGVPGVIGNGAHLDGHSVMQIAARPALAVMPGGGLTFASWVRLDTEASRTVLYSQSQDDRHLEIGVAGAKLYAQVTNGRHTNRVESTAPLTVGRWQHVAVSMGTEIALYIDGSPAGSAASGGLPGINGDVLIGALDDSGVAGGFTGELDEVEISKISRSAWWARVRREIARMLATRLPGGRNTGGFAPGQMRAARI